MKRIIMGVFVVCFLIVFSFTKVGAEEYSLQQTYSYRSCKGSRVVSTVAGAITFKGSYLVNLTTGKTYHSWSYSVKTASGYAGAYVTKYYTENPYGTYIRAGYGVFTRSGASVTSNSVDIPTSNCSTYSSSFEPYNVPVIVDNE